MSQNSISNPSFEQLLTNFGFVWTCLRMSGWKTFVKGFWSTYKRLNHKQTLLYKILITEFLINNRSYDWPLGTGSYQLYLNWILNLQRKSFFARLRTFLPTNLNDLELRIFAWPSIPNEATVFIQIYQKVPTEGSYFPFLQQQELYRKEVPALTSLGGLTVGGVT